MKSEGLSTEFMSSQNSLVASQLHTEIFKMDASITHEPEGAKVASRAVDGYFSIEHGKKELEQKLTKLLRRQNKRAYEKMVDDKRKHPLTKGPGPKCSKSPQRQHNSSKAEDATANRQQFVISGQMGPASGLLSSPQ